METDGMKELPDCHRGSLVHKFIVIIAASLHLQATARALLDRVGGHEQSCLFTNEQCRPNLRELDFRIAQGRRLRGGAHWLIMFLEYT